jgi:nucleotide-binding universal stress UspA family protein
VPEGVTVEPIITEGPVSHTILRLSDEVSADLIVLTAHGTHADDHASITRQMLENGRRAVLVLHDPGIESRTPRFAGKSAERQVVVAPTNLTPNSRAALELGFDLARTLPIELHLLHILPNGRSRRNGASDADAQSQLRALVPADLADRVKLHLEHGEPAGGIAQAADRLSASCIVMGEHARTPVRRWFSRDTSREVLDQAHCPVWYVPNTATV